jgi:hypothetical protein
MARISQDEIRARVNQGLYRPLSEIAEYESPVDGLGFGLSAIDKTTGGLRPSKLNIVAGFSSHGKSSLMMTLAVRYMDEGVLYVTSDDTDDMVLGKLIAMHAGMEFEEVMKRGNAKFRKRYCREHFGSLLVAAPRDGGYNKGKLAILYQRATDEFGFVPKVAFFDFLTLLDVGPRGEGFQGARNQARDMKALCRETEDTVWLVGHQKNRSALEGQAQLMTHLEMAQIVGQESDGHILGVRRKIDVVKMDDEEMLKEELVPTTHVAVMKNKVTGRRSPTPVGVEYVIDPVSGIIREYSDEDNDRLGALAPKPASAAPKARIANPWANREAEDD